MAKTKRYTILVEQGDENLSAYCPDVPGCVATGASFDEVVEQMIEALAFHIEGLVEGGEPIPARTIRAVDVAIPVPEAPSQAA